MFPAWLNTRYNVVMAHDPDDITAEFQRGWDAALEAVKYWHEAQAKKTMVQARRARFPKTLEQEAAMHEKSAELILSLSPQDV